MVATLTSSSPASARLSVRDAAGRLVVRRRFHRLSLTLALPAGAHTFSVEDERAAHDPRRLAGSSVVVDVPAEPATSITADLHLVPGGVLRATVLRDGAIARHARVRAQHADGHVVEGRTDGDGLATLGGLHAGAWTLSATDARRTRCTPPLTVTVGPGEQGVVRLELDTATSELLVRVGGTDRRDVTATTVTATAVDGSRVTAPLVRGQAHLRGLRPGTQVLTVPPSLGHLGTTLEGPDLAPGVLGAVDVVVPVGACVSGRVVGRSARGQHAAVVALLDAGGAEVERVRTDEHGRFVLGTGLGSLTGLTVVATSGPELLDVTRAALADLAVTVGVRHDVGTIRLPSARRADWTPRDRAIAAMKLPSTRV